VLRLAPGTICVLVGREHGRDPHYFHPAEVHDVSAKDDIMHRLLKDVEGIGKGCVAAPNCHKFGAADMPDLRRPVAEETTPQRRIGKGAYAVKCDKSLGHNAMTSTTINKRTHAQTSI
jgi:hypothetical protein